MAAPSEQQLRALLAGLPQLLWRSCDAGNWVWSSPQWLAFTGQTQAESEGEGWLGAVHPDDREQTRAAWRGARERGQLEVDFRVRDAVHGGYRWHRTRSNPGRDPAGRIVEWFGSTTDVDELKRLQERQQQLLAELAARASQLEAEIAERIRTEARLLHEAHHDGLTQLHSRRFLLDRLGEALARPGSPASAVLLLDLDRLKLVNNSLGRDSGDRLLVEIALRLRSCARPQDTLARLGSDEFAILFDGGDAEQAAALAAAIREAVSRPIWLDEKELFCSCSIGISVTQPDCTAEAVLRDAGIALNEAKRSGREVVRFSNDMHAAVIDSLQLRGDLRRAIAREELELYYQPVCAIDTGRIVGMEALVRWRRGVEGLVPPGRFISVAEETGLIHGIGAWVLQAACRQLRVWRDRFPQLSLDININTSGEELKSSGFCAQLQAALHETGLDAKALQLEITESIFLEQPERMGEVLDQVRALGVRVALDDFGTGYSSLSYLDQFQFDTIKIDRSFVASMARRPRMPAVIEAIVTLGRAVGLTVVAEGVEDESQLQALRRAGCNLVQGYLMGRPMPAAEFSRLLHSQAADIKPSGSREKSYADRPKQL